MDQSCFFPPSLGELLAPQSHPNPANPDPIFKWEVHIDMLPLQTARRGGCRTRSIRCAESHRTIPLTMRCLAEALQSEMTSIFAFTKSRSIVVPSSVTSLTT